MISMSDFESLVGHHLYRLEDSICAELKHAPNISRDRLARSIERRHRAFAACFVDRLTTRQRAAALKKLVLQMLEQRNEDLLHNARNRPASERRRWN